MGLFTPQETGPTSSEGSAARVVRKETSVTHTPDVSQAIHTYLTRAPTSEFHGQDVALLAHWQGSDNLLWRVHSRGREAVLKLFLDAGQARSRRQFDGHQTAAPLGLAPYPLWYDRYPEGLARQVMVYEWAPGDPLDLSDPAELEALAVGVARLHQEDPGDVRRVSPNPVNPDFFWQVLQAGLEPVRGWLANQGAAALSPVFDRLATQAAGLVASARPLWQGAPPTPVHGDLKPENCIHSFGAPLLVDWEMFGLGDPALEVARFLFFGQAQMDEEGRQLWLEHYHRHQDGPGLARRVELYRRLLPFHALCFLLDGLRRAVAATEEREALAQNRRFLTDTIGAAWTQAVIWLLNRQPDPQEIAGSIGQLMDSIGG